MAHWPFKIGDLLDRSWTLEVRKVAVVFALLLVLSFVGCSGLLDRTDKFTTRPAEGVPSALEETIVLTAPGFPAPWREFLLVGVGTVAGWYGEKRRRERVTT